MRRYRELLAIAGVPRLTVAVLLSRVSTSMFNLALLVAVTQGYGYGEAGLLMMVFALTNAVAGPVRGRLADRRRPRRLMLVLLGWHVGAYAGLAVGIASGAPVGVLYAVAVVLGASVPPAGPVVRSLWPHLVPAGRLPTAYAFDAALNTATFVSGPLFAGALLLVLPAFWVLAATGVVKLVGDALVAVAPALRARPEPSTKARRRGFGPLANGRVRLMLTMVALDTFGFGCLEVTAVAAARSEGSAGVFTSALAVGGVVSGVAYGARAWPGTARTQLVVLHLGAAVALAAGSLAGAAGFGLVLVGLVFAAVGLCTGPVETLQQVLIGEHSPDDQRIEAFAWVFSTMWVGFGVGTTVAGQLAEPGVTGPTLLAAGLAQLGIVVLAAAKFRD
ncbi:MAG TPA: MFS transporter [Actinophytocola sp.]|nr:MFS transporter [Actinophytocola sp.]